jgi:rfaE bifunctional protein kinase chain/domain
MEQLIRGWKNKRVVVVGDVGVDRYTSGAVERISPEAPVPILRVEKEELKLGLAANVADNLRVLGAKPFLVGVIGRDRLAEELKVSLKKAGIDSRRLVTDRNRRTVLKERLVSGPQQLLRVDYEDTTEISSPTQKALLAQVTQLVRSGVDALIIEDYAKGVLATEMTQKILALCKRAGVLTLSDPNRKSPLELYRGTDVLKPNLKEAEVLSGIKINSVESLQEAARFLMKKTQAKKLVITRGKDGLALFESGKRGMQVLPTFAREVYDVSGAGDTVISVLTLGLTAGGSLRDAAYLGNVAAGVEVAKRGTATVSPQELREALAQSRMN